MVECELAKRKCVPCRGGVPPLRGEALDQLVQQLGGDWRVVDEHHIEKQYALSDFREALTWTNVLGEIAEEEGHHPDIQLGWGKVRVILYTHKVDGLTESDFILAAKYDEALRRRSPAS